MADSTISISVVVRLEDDLVLQGVDSYERRSKEQPSNFRALLNGNEDVEMNYKEEERSEVGRGGR
jgi:hypothetical protein